MQHQPEHWQRLTGETGIERLYRRLGGRIAFLVALESAAEELTNQTSSENGYTPTEQHMHLKGCVNLALRVVEDAMQAVVDAKPWFGDELVLTKVVLVKGLDNPDTVGYGSPN